MNALRKNSKEDRELREILRGPGAAADLDRMSARIAAEAGNKGLLDVAYARDDSPYGEMLLAATSKGLVKVALPNQDADEVLAELASRISPRVLEAPARLDDVRRELDDYFEGRRQEFDLPLDWRLSHGFRRRVLRAIHRIPYGETVTYTDMARSAGNVRAVRAAGSACGYNPIPIVVPCHRVLRTGGALGGYGGGLEMKEGLLKLEGVLG
jgi:methylated-DNA-[protein]-cysteine S-methyltransferase